MGVGFSRSSSEGSAESVDTLEGHIGFLKKCGAISGLAVNRHARRVRSIAKSTMRSFRRRSMTLEDLEGDFFNSSSNNSISFELISLPVKASFSQKLQDSQVIILLSSDRYSEKCILLLSL